MMAGYIDHRQDIPTKGFITAMKKTLVISTVILSIVWFLGLGVLLAQIESVQSVQRNVKENFKLYIVYNIIYNIVYNVIYIV